MSRYIFNSNNVNLKEIKRAETPEQVIKAVANAKKTINLTFMERLTKGLKATKKARESKKNQGSIIDNLFNK